MRSLHVIVYISFTFSILFEKLTQNLQNFDVDISSPTSLQ